MNRPKNVLAILGWYRQNRPDQLERIQRLFPLRTGFDPTLAEIDAEACRVGLQSLILQGFEAGRDFQRENPDVKSGIGYLN